MCKYHANVLFLLTSLSSYVPQCADIDTFLKFIACDSNEIYCMWGKCKECAPFTIKVLRQIPPDVENKQIKWKLWSTVDSEPAVIEETGSVKKASESLCHQMESQFKFHHYIKRTQEKALKDAKIESTAQDIVLQIDFAENYSCTSQNETQAAHFSKNTISLFTVEGKAGERIIKMALVSDDKQHDTYSVHHYLKVIMLELKKELSDLKTIKIFSDGSAAQFKNR